MNSKETKYLDEKEYDISEYYIRGHAISRYSEKCLPGLSMIQTSIEMREKMKKVRKIEFKNKKEKNKNRISYMDEDKNIYITEKNDIVTVFPSERIFVSKTFYSNKKTGQKYL